MLIESDGFMDRFVDFCHVIESVHDVETTKKRIVERLEEEFGIIFEMDVSAIMKKIGHEMDEYKIIGVCNPRYASSILSIDKRVGTLLPCSIAIYREKGRTFISIPSSSAFPG